MQVNHNQEAVFAPQVSPQIWLKFRRIEWFTKLVPAPKIIEEYMQTLSEKDVKAVVSDAERWHHLMTKRKDNADQPLF